MSWVEEKLEVEVKNQLSNLFTQAGYTKYLQNLKYIKYPGGLLVIAESPLLYILYGRRPGKMPPKAPIEDWIGRKNILPRNTTLDGLNFLIRRVIGRRGTKGKDFIKPLDLKDFRELIKVNIIQEFTYGK